MAKQAAGSVRRKHQPNPLPLARARAVEHRRAPPPPLRRDPRRRRRTRSGDRPISKRSRCTSAASRRCSATPISRPPASWNRSCASIPEERELHERRAALPQHLPAAGDAAAKPRRRPSTSASTPRRSPSTAGSTTRRSRICAWSATRIPTTITRSTCSPSAHAQRDEHAEAVAHLERAIALNPENRALARNDPDLEPLRDDDAFRAALEAPPDSAAIGGARSRRDPRDN